MRTILSKGQKFLFLFLIIFAQNVKAQDWSGSCQGAPCTLTFSPGTGNTVTASFNPYYSWSTFDYTLTTALNLTNNATVKFGVNASIGTSAAGKFLVVTLTDAANHSTGWNAGTVVAIPTDGQELKYSIDFHLTGNTSFDFTQVKKLKFWIADNISATNSTSGATGSFTVSNIEFGTGVNGFSGLTNPSAGQLWRLSSSNVITNANSGNVLVGDFSSIAPSLTSNPYYKFVVNGRTNFIGTDNVIGIWSPTTSSTGRHYLGITNKSFASGTEYTSITSGAWTITSDVAPQPLTFQNFQDPSGTGNVGIGYHDTAPAAKLSVNGKVFVNTSCAPTDAQLAVNGKIYATAVKLELPNGSGCFPDYVFESDYKLKTLTEVENYIKTNKHLPEVPSAVEVETNGIDVVEMDAILLKKIEELTLYMIEMKKENEMLKQKVENLEQNQNN